MEYSIKELSRLAGVTTRTLRWYDEINLLKPSRTAQSGYRYYGPAEVDRLQDILFYRALGVELAQIKACLDAPSFDRLAVLRSHLTALEMQQARLNDLIQSVKDTINAEERNEIMADEKKFEAFKRRAAEQYEETYGEEVRSLYGDESVEAAKNTMLNLTSEQYRTWTELGNTIANRLEQAVRANLSPCGKEGEEITALHRRWLTISGSACSIKKHKGLAELYLADERFTAYYDRNIPGCAQFLRDAVLYWAGK